MCSCLIADCLMGKRRLLLVCGLLFLACTFLKCLFHFHLNPADDDFTSINTCPACYGSNLCPQFLHGEITLIGGSRLKYFQFLNRKNIFYGKLRGERVILKKLAHDWEIKQGDIFLCQQAKLNFSCDVVTAVNLLLGSVPPKQEAYFLNTLKVFNSSTDISKCPSERLLSHIYHKINSEYPDGKNDIPSNEKVAKMMYGIFINPESVILQAFSQNEGWPFPMYRGSCGRIIVEEYVGRQLTHYEDSSWEQRLDLSYQLLQMAQLLTENSLGFALYMTDVTMENFAVRPDGTLMLVDVENIVVVDRWKIRKDKAGEWDHLHRNKGELCHNCLSFSYEDLCSHDMSDHNYYAICKGLLVPGAYYSSRGLLHSIPTKVNKKTNLSLLMKECAQPTSDLGRFTVVPKILQVMKSLL